MPMSRLGSHTLPIEQGRLPGQRSRATFAGAPFAMYKLWEMSSIVTMEHTMALCV